MLYGIKFSQYLAKSNCFYNNTLRLYIPFRKYIEFESILKDHSIKYSIDFATPNSMTDFVRFYFDTKDRSTVDELLTKNEINTTDDFFVTTDFKNENQQFFLVEVFRNSFIFCADILFIF